MTVFDKLPPNCLIDFPSGRWGFVGSVDIRLGKLLDGHTIESEEDQRTAAESYDNPYSKRVKTRTFATREEAIQAATDLGLTVTLPKPA